MKRETKRKARTKPEPVSLKGEELYLSLQKQWKNSMALRRNSQKGKN